MPEHRDLTGASLHESKGVDSAAANTVYVANGAGSGAWSKLPAAAVDTSTIKNTNKEHITVFFDDIGTAGSRYIPILRACKINLVYVSPQLATAGSTTVITLRNDAGTAMGTINIPSAAAAGSLQTTTPVANNTFTAGTKLQIDTDGGTSTASDAIFTIEIEWT